MSAAALLFSLLGSYAFARMGEPQAMWLWHMKEKPECPISK